MVIIRGNHHQDEMDWAMISSAPDVYRNDPTEMAIDYASDVFKGFNKATIDIKEAVRRTYDQAGWVYQNGVLFRIRCDEAVLKSVTFRK